MLRITKTLFFVFAVLLCESTLAQTDLRNIELYGRVTSQGGRGITGVAVTDGQNVTTTDSKGHYKLLSNAASEFVYLSLPSGYEVAMESNSPLFFKRIESPAKSRQRHDFRLTALARGQDKHIFIACADPQVYFDQEIDSLKRAAKDMSNLVENTYSCLPAYGVVCGDIIGDITKKPSYFTSVKSALAESKIPFFYVMGNHDMDIDVSANDHSKRTFKANFGPTYYSFNRGKIHYVVLEDNFFLARSYLYVGYLTQQQINWLKQDLSLIAANSTVVVCMHIPTYSREARAKKWSEESTSQVMNNRKALYNLLKPFNAHIMSGHEHYNENYVLNQHLYEHVHAPLSNLFWQAPWSMDGVPSGYGVYIMDGDSISWYYKSVGYEPDYQFNGYKVGENRWKPLAVTANVWNYDPSWSVKWFEDGLDKGEMERYTGYDPSIYNYVVEHQARFKHKYIGAAQTEHMFFATPTSATSHIRIEVKDRFGKLSVWENQ